MDNDLNEYDTFEPIYYLSSDGEEELDTEPMTDYDWAEFLEVDSLS